MSTEVRPFMEYLKDLPIGQVSLSTTNPRKAFDEAKMLDLVNSIASKGIQQPLIVRRLSTKEEGYECVAGERRFRAAQELNLSFLPCIIRELTDQEAFDLQIVENLQRVDIHPVEEAEAYAEIMASDPSITVDEVAARVGKAPGYVAQRLRLRTLELDAKLLFVKGHINLGHALLMARLEPADQIRAVWFMMGIDPKQTKESLTQMIGRRLENLSSGGNTDYRGRVRHDRGRLVETTEAQLKLWIEQNVLLKLANVPWDLDDDLLVKLAGPCTTCPKRSGANAALFSDLTAEEDICLDPTCFAAKQQAVVNSHTNAAKGQGEKLLKISAAHSEVKMDEPAVVDGVVVGRKAVKEGQWVPANSGSCPNVVEAVVVDGPDKGKLKSVCPDQKCKVHKHKLYSPNHHYGTQATPEELAKEEAAKRRREAWVIEEPPIRVRVYKAIRAKVKPGPEILRYMVMAMINQRNAAVIAQVVGVPVRTKGDSWEIAQDAIKQLHPYVLKASEEELMLLGFDILHADAAKVEARMFSNRKGDRAPLWALAEKYKVDANAIAKESDTAFLALAKGSGTTDLKAKVKAQRAKRIASANKALAKRATKRV